MTRSLSKTSAVITAAIIALSACGPRPPMDAKSAVDHVAENYLSQTPLVGISVAVARDGEIVHEAGYGFAQRDPDTPAGPDVPFEIFSVGKTATAALVLRLAERGALDIDVPIGGLVPNVDSEYARVTLRQLLGHTSGIAEIVIDEVTPNRQFLRPPSSREHLLAEITRGELRAPPDATWLYNNSGFVVAGIAAEEAASSTYSELVRTELREPANVEAFGYCPEFDAVRAQGSIVLKSTPEPIPPIDFGWFGGAGSLCATAGDLVRWWTALHSGKLLSAESLAQMTTPVTLEHDDMHGEFGYGLGLRLGAYGGHSLVGHTGNGAGGTAVLIAYPDDGLVIAVLTNTAGRGVPHALEIEADIARAILAIEIPQPAREPIPVAALQSAPGRYLSPEGEFCVSAREERLFVAANGGELQELLHQGAGRFRRRDDNSSEEYFLGWPDRIGWFAYEIYGIPMDLATRVADVCAPGVH